MNEGLLNYACECYGCKRKPKGWSNPAPQPVSMFYEPQPSEYYYAEDWYTRHSEWKSRQYKQAEKIRKEAQRRSAYQALLHQENRVVPPNTFPL